MTTRITSNWQWKPIHFIIILAVLQLFIALMTNGFALSTDEAMWHYIGRNWFRNGLVPYHGGVDNKSPLFFTVFGLSDLLFGVNYWFPRVFGTLCQCIGIYYIYKIADKISGRKAGLMAISLYGLSVMWHGADGRYVSYTETFDTLFIILSFYYFLNVEGKKGYFISGFLSGIGLGFRLSAVFSIAAMFISSFKKTREATLMFCTGVLSGAVCLALAYVLAGLSLHDVFVYTFADNFGKGSTTDHDFWWKMVQFHTMFFYSEVMMFYPLVIIYLYIKKRVDWLMLWVILVFVGINVLGNYARVDLKDLLPCLSLVGALTLSYLIDKYDLPFRKVMLIIWVCFSPKIVEPLINVPRLFQGEYQHANDYCHAPYIQPDESASRQLGQWVKANTSPQDKVFVAGGGAQVQAYSERISPTIYFSSMQTALAKQRFYDDMAHSKASMVLVPLFPEYTQYVDQDLRDYVTHMVAKDYYLERCLFNYNVYRLKK